MATEEKSKIVEFKGNERIETDTEVTTEEYNDTIVEEHETYTVVEEHEEGEFLSFAVDGVFKDEAMTKQKNRLELMTEPPHLTIQSSSGDEVSFPLTYQFNQSMIRALEGVNYAYLGIKPKKKKEEDDDEESLGIVDTIKENRILILQLLLGLIMGMFLAKGFVIPTIVAFLASVVVLFRAKLPNSKHDNEESSENEKDDIDSDENNTSEVE